MTDDFEKMKSEQESLMPEVVYIQALTRTSDGAGGWSEVWTTVATTKGRIAAKDTLASEGEVGGKVSNRQVYVITLPADVSLTESNRLQVSGVQYEIISIMTRSKKTATRVQCVEV